MPGPPSESRTLPGLGDHLRPDRGGPRPGRAGRRLRRPRRGGHRSARAGYLLDRLLTRGANGERLALEVASRLTPPLPAEHLPTLVDLVENPRFPTRLRVPVAAQVIRSVPGSSQFVERVVEALRRRVARPRRLAGCGGWPRWSHRRPPCRGPWPSWTPAPAPRARGAGPGSIPTTWSSTCGSGTGCCSRTAGSASRGT